MQPGKIVLIAFVTSAITASGTFFGLHLTVGKKARHQAAAAAVGAMPSHTPPPVAGGPAAAGDPAVPVTVKVTPTPATPAPPAAPVAAAPAPAKPAGVREAQTTVTDVKNKVEVPRVTGVWLHSAQGRLRKAGLKNKVRYTYDEDRSEGLVLRQHPRAGDRVDPGSTVSLTVNRDYD